MQLEQFLCDELSVTPDALRRFLSAAPNKYKIYTIPKRSFGKRVIAQPSKKLKVYQRAAIKHLSTFYQVHHCATAYKKGSGIRVNAEKHLNSRYLLKMDFQDYFRSITEAFFFQMSERMKVEITESDKQILTKLIFWNPTKKSGGKHILSIGAPTSPFISNSIIYLFDDALTAECKSRGVTYTRYADDLTFSTNVKNALFTIPALVKELLLSELEGYITVNEAKTVFTSKAHNRHVTGVTITNDNQISLGRARKRYISSLIHKFTLNQLPSEDMSHLQGLLAFALDIEPSFVGRMKTKYGDVLDKLLTGAV